MTVAEAVSAKMAELQKKMPEDFKVDTMFNTAAFVKSSMSEIFETIWVSFILIVLILLIGR